MANVTGVCGNRYQDYISGINRKGSFAGGVALTLFANALIGRNVSGYCVKFDDTANLKLVGQFAESPRKMILAADADGDNVWDIAQPRYFEAKCSDTVTAADHGRPVYALYDDEVSISPGTYGNLAGVIRGVNTTVSPTILLIEPIHGYDSYNINWWGRITKAATGTLTLLISELGKTICLQNSGSQTVNLPALSTVPLGFGYNFVKLGTTAQTVTITGNGSELVNGSNTNTQLATKYESATCIKIDNGGTSEWLMATFT